MNLKRFQSRSGFTLIELLLFSAIFALVSVAFVAIFIVITRVQSRENSVISVSQESQFVVQQLRTLVQGASLIEMPVNLAMATITLRMAASSSDPTLIFVSSSRLYIKEGTASAQPLTTDRILISTSSFIKRSNARGYDSLQISFKIDAVASSTQHIFTKTVNTSVARTSPAAFDSDITPSLGPIKLGSSTNDIDSINHLLFFRGSNVGISSDGQTPHQRLQIDDGGVRLNNTLPRPTCDSNLRGTLWFTPDNTPNDSIGDIISICFLSLASGQYYWTQTGTGYQTSTFVDQSSSQGQYNSLAVPKNQRDRIYVSYYRQAGGDLYFSSSSNGTMWSTPLAIDWTYNVGQDNSIAAPTTSIIYISYADLDNNALKFAKSTNGGAVGSWAVTNVDLSGNQGQYTSIAAADVNNIYISYYDAGNADLRIAYNSNGGNPANWTMTTVDGQGGKNVGQYTSIASPQPNIAYVCYYDQQDDDLEFVWTTNYGASWTTSTLDSVITGGSHCSIDAPSANTIFISYYSKTNGINDGQLKFIRSITGPTGFEAPYTLDNVIGTGKYSSVTSPDGEKVFIAYHEFSSSPGGHNLRQAFSQLGGATAGAWTKSVAVTGIGTQTPKNVDADWLDNWTYIVSYPPDPSGTTYFQVYKVGFDSPLFE
ncbi:MAG: hypothetical protein AAB691_03245 [Patescibacteria group bacterium]